MSFLKMWCTRTMSDFWRLLGFFSFSFVLSTLVHLLPMMHRSSQLFHYDFWVDFIFQWCICNSFAFILVFKVHILLPKVTIGLQSRFSSFFPLCILRISTLKSIYLFVMKSYSWFSFRFQKWVFGAVVAHSKWISWRQISQIPRHTVIPNA